MTHFQHQNIIRWSETRKHFKTIEEHDQTLINNWNSVVSNNDRVFVLGDFAFGDKSNVPNILSKLNGYKVLIFGNHDLHWCQRRWLDAGFDSVLPMKEYKNCILTHIPLDERETLPEGRWVLNIHGHLHDEGNTDRLILSGRICVSAEQINLTPISWEQLWKKVTVDYMYYKPFSEAIEVYCSRRGPLKCYNVNGSRIKGQFFDAKKQSYKLVYFDEKHDIILIEDKKNIRINVKPKHFVGIR